MKKRISTLHRTLLATGVAVGLGLSLSQTALADTAEGELEIHAGLSTAMTVSCPQALSFGITTLPEENRGGETTLTLDPDDDSISVGGQTDDIATGTGQAGECTISGADVNASMTVTVEDGGSEVGLLEQAVLGLDAADAGASISVTSFTTNPDPVQTDENGNVTFNIGGTMTIPEMIGSTGMGGYVGTATVTVDDGV